MYLFPGFIYFDKCTFWISRSVLHTVEAHSNFTANLRHLVLKTYISLIISSVGFPLKETTKSVTIFKNCFLLSTFHWRLNVSKDKVKIKKMRLYCIFFPKKQLNANSKWHWAKKDFKKSCNISELECPILLCKAWQERSANEKSTLCQDVSFF